MTAPAYFPITLTSAKAHARIDHDNDDAYLQGLIAAAVGKAERYLRRRLVTQTWQYFLSDWPSGDCIILPFGRLQSVTHVKYKDADGDQSTWSSANYIVDTDSDPGRVVLGYNESYPTAALYPSNPIEIQFVCGYGDHAPQSITGATNASPIVLTVASHGLSDNDLVLVENVGGNTNANGLWRIETVDANSFKLLSSSGNSAYTSGGTAVKQDAPIDIRQAVFLMLSDMYENREDILVGQSVHNLRAAKTLLTPHILYGGP